MSAVHVCVFRGERVPPTRPEWVRIVETGQIIDVADYPAPVRCDGLTRRGHRCKRTATTGVLYAWGCVGLCDECAELECGAAPEPELLELPDPKAIPAVHLGSLRRRRRYAQALAERGGGG